MILFSEDWSKYPNAILHLSTKNQSFLTLAKKLKMMGVKNHAFMLALINPNLEHLDPYDPNLTEEQRSAIAVECKINPWYFFREVARAPAKGSGGDPSMFRADRANISTLWSFFNHVQYFLIQPRQTGKSFTIDMLTALLMNIMCERVSITLLTKDDKLRSTTIKRIKEIMDELPPYLDLRGRGDAQNTESITVNRRHNEYIALVPQASEKRALMMGRGISSPVFLIDEPPFQPNIKISLGAALAATGAVYERAKANDTPYGVIFTTTAGKKDDKDGSYVYNLLMEAAVWSEHFYDCVNQAELHTMVRRHSRSTPTSRNGVLRINGTFNHLQLGRDDEWLATRLEEALQSGDEATRDFFNIWTSGSESSPFTEEMAARIAASVRNVEYTQISEIGTYMTRWYLPEDEIEYALQNSKFILAIDPSDAGKGDDISFLIRDIETMEVVAAGNYNETNLLTFGQYIADLLITYENITLIIERKSSGPTIIDIIIEYLVAAGIDPFRRIFNRAVQEHSENQERYREISQPMDRRPRDIYTRYKTTFGYPTAGSGEYSRDNLYARILQNSVKLYGNKVADAVTVNQIVSLVYVNGRIDHSSGNHDDMVIAWLLNNWLLMSGKNLKHYGIDIMRVGNRNCDNRKEDTDDYYFEQEQNLIRERMATLQDRMTDERDECVYDLLERQYRKLANDVVARDGEIYNIDELVHRIQEERRSGGLESFSRGSMDYHRMQLQANHRNAGVVWSTTVI